MHNQKGIILVMTLLMLSVMTLVTLMMLERTMLMLKIVQHLYVQSILKISITN